MSTHAELLDPALERLRRVDWDPPLDAARTQLAVAHVRTHYDRVRDWLRAYNAAPQWPHLELAALVPTAEAACAKVRLRLQEEPWFERLHSNSIAPRTITSWLAYLLLRAAGDVPHTLADPFEPLVRAFEIGGTIMRSRELRNELHIGLGVTLRIPASIDEW